MVPVAVQKRHRNRARAARLAEHVVPAAVEGLKRAACVAVGEKHSLALQHWCCKPLASWPFDAAAAGEEALARSDVSTPEQVHRMAAGPSVSKCIQLQVQCAWCCCIQSVSRKYSRYYMCCISVQEAQPAWAGSQVRTPERQFPWCAFQDFSHAALLISRSLI